MRKKYYRNIKNILLIKRKKIVAVYYFKKVDNIYKDEDGLGLTVEIQGKHLLYSTVWRYNFYRE